VKHVGGLTPEEIASRSFSSVGRRGVDRAEVSDFLSEVAGAFRTALEMAERTHANPTFDHLGAEAAALLRNATEGADRLRAQAEHDAEKMRREAKEESEAGRRQAQEESLQLRRSAEEEASSIIATATEEAERRVREAELVARRFSNVTKRQCDQMVAEAQDRAQRLDAYEREMRQRISDMEAVFQSFKAEMEATGSRLEEPASGAEGGDEISVVHTPDREEKGAPKPSGVQPKPIFDSESVSS
jgi:DivIVA domain-containing protein